MGYILGLDGSQFQGNNIDFNQVKAAGYLFWLQRMTYAYPGDPLSIDPTAQGNYYGAKAVGMIVGGYHKIGWTDPVAEADFFLAAMSPLVENDILAHDMEPASDCPIPDNWVEWEQAYVQRIYDRTGTYSVRYENISMNNDMPPTGVVSNCPSWVAAPSFSWDDTVPVNVPVTIQQGATVHVPGITANVCDTDAFFAEGSSDQILAQLNKIGYHAQQPIPSPLPVVPPVVVPPVDPPVVTPPILTPPISTPTPPVKKSPIVSVTALKPVVKKHWYDVLIELLKQLKIIN